MRRAAERWVRCGAGAAAAACEPDDLLVVGAGRRGAVRHLISSRVSRYCLARAGCPVVAVPPPDLDHAVGHGLRAWAFRHRGEPLSRPA
jgi:nucleotide-binding universal stress UspA family protein